MLRLNKHPGTVKVKRRAQWALSHQRLRSERGRLWAGVQQTAKNWLKTVGRRVKRCERERGWKWRRGGRRGKRGLVVSCDLKQLFLCGTLKMDPRSFPLRLASLFMLPVYSLQWDRDLLPTGERKEISLTEHWITAVSKLFYKRVQRCKLLLSAVTSVPSVKGGGASSEDGASCRWSCDS